MECRTDGAMLPAGNRSAYVGTATIEEIDAAQAVLLIGTNPRTEAPVLNARIRKAWLRGASVTAIGEAADLTYEHEHLGDGVGALRDFDRLDAERAVVIVGQGALTRPDGEAVLGHAMRIADGSGAPSSWCCTPPRAASARWTWAP